MKIDPLEDYFRRMFKVMKTLPKKKIPKSLQREVAEKTLIHITEQKILKCPICGETKIIWKCGHAIVLES